MKVSIIIPVYNEARTIEELLERVMKVKIPAEKELVIVESNSTDGTREIVRKYSKRRGVKLVLQDRPAGKGNALKVGFSRASGDIILIQDGDLEYKPEEYPYLLKPILEGQASFVLGSRHLGKGDWKIRKFVENSAYARALNFGGLFYTSLFNVLYGVRLTDPATMFKIFRRDCIKDIEFKSNIFELDWEIVAKLIKRGYRPQELSVSYASRDSESGKKIRFFRDGVRVFFAILRFRFFD
jgi:glycosyltransferase involved in cell wall biosynthesis